MRRFIPLAVAVVSITAGACATLSVSSHVEPGLDFSQYSTFDWGEPDALPVSDPRLAGDPNFNDWVQGAVERNLARKGLMLAPEGTDADLQVHYHAHISDRIDLSTIDQDFGFCTGEGCQPEVEVYEAGTLVIDIVDPRTQRILWRGWAQGSVEDELDNPDAMEATIENAVARMLALFPRSL